MWVILFALLATLAPSVARADELSLTTSFTYNENDVVETVTTPDGVVSTLAYDAVDRLSSVSYSQGGGGVSGITYTDLGQVASVTDTDTEGTIQFHYDPRFHGLTDVIYPEDGGSLHHAYDGFGRVINTRAGGAGGAGSGESYHYDQENRVIQVSADHGATTVTHDPLTGRVSRVQLGSGITEDYTYDSVTGEVTTVTQRQPGGGLIAQYSYTYYANGLKESVTETSPERGTETVTYEYDELQRLSRAIYDLADLSQRIESYEYDANGNRLRRHVTVDSETVEDTRYRYNGLNQIVQAGNEVIYHNARGNIVKRITPGAVLRETTYEWDSANRLVEVTKKENNQEVLSILYHYNGLGQRIGRSVSRPGHPLEETQYVNSTGGLYQPLMIEDGGGTTVVYPGGSAYQRGGKARYELTGTGGVTRVLGSNGQLVASYRYDAFGRILESEEDAVGGRTKRYRGEDWDEESGLLYLRSRYYDPDLGRFLSVDPHPGFATQPQTLNPYVYCHNDPVNFADPTGLCETKTNWWLESLSMGVGSIPILGAGQGLVELIFGYDFITDQPVHRGIATAGLVAGIFGAKGAVKGLSKIPFGKFFGDAAAKTTEIVGQNGTKITGFTKHGIDRVVGDGAKRAGVKPEALLDALKNPKKITSGVDSQGRPFQVFAGQNARVVVNPQTGKVVSTNPLSGAGAH